MWTPSFLTAPVRIARLVDEGGQVHCPMSMRDVNIERCLSCPTRSDLTRRDGTITEIVCQPSLSSLITTV